MRTLALIRKELASYFAGPLGTRGRGASRSCPRSSPDDAPESSKSSLRTATAPFFCTFVLLTDARYRGAMTEEVTRKYHGSA